MINRIPPNNAEIGQEIVAGAQRFKLEAAVLGNEMYLEYSVEGRIDMDEPGAQGKVAKLVRAMLTTLAEKVADCDDC